LTIKKLPPMTLDEKKDRARALTKQGRTAEAIAAWEAITGEEPKDGNAWWNLGCVYRTAKNTEKSVMAHRESVKISPRGPVNWAYLAWAYLENEQTEEAEKAALHGFKLSPTEVSCLRALSDVSEKTKNWSRRVTVLTAIDELGEATGHDLNCLGIAHLNLKSYGQAIRYFLRSASHTPSIYPLFNAGLAYNNPEVSQDVDAIDAWRRALAIDSTYARAKERIDSTGPRLLKLATQALAYGDTLLKRSEWFQFYINPFELINAESGKHLDDFDTRTLQRMRKALLQEINLEDGKVSWLDNTVVDQSRAIGLCDELNDDEKREFHWQVFQDKNLLKFITRGEIKHFLHDPTQSPLDTLDALDAEFYGFREWLSEPFARQYNLVLGKALESCGTTTAIVECLFDGRRWVLPEHDDICFEKAQIITLKSLDPLRALAERTKETKPELAYIDRVLSEKNLIETFNLLPVHFRAVQGEAVKLIRSISIDLHNLHSDTDAAKAALQLSKKFSFKSADLNHQLEEDFKKLEELIREQRKHEAKLTSGSVAWEVTKDGVRQGDRFIATESICSMRWGIMVTGTQYAEVHEYILAFKNDGAREVVFSWKAHENHDKQQEHFNKLVQAAIAYIMPTIVSKVVAKIESGQELSIGTCKVMRGGVVFDTQGWIFSKTNIVPWGRVSTELQRGQLVVFDRAAPKTKTIMPLIKTENAMVLSFLSETRE
jgi:tetratricopeptide (TPR) repeat protein